VVGVRRDGGNWGWPPTPTPTPDRIERRWPRPWRSTAATGA